MYVAFAAIAAVSSVYAIDAAASTTHTVQSGDSLWKIAQKYQTSVANIQELNQ
jgi:LysM repeat protein